MRLFFALTLLIGSASHAQEMLTHEQGPVLVMAQVKDSLYRDDIAAKLEEVGRHFEDKVFPAVPPAILDRIRDEKFKIVFMNTREKGAVFAEREPDSGRLLIVVNTLYLTHPTLSRLLTHEWFHALQYVLHPGEPSWFNEGMAQVFERLVFGGYSGPTLVEALRRSTTPLEYVFTPLEKRPEAYGHTFLYFHFLHARCGGTGLFWKLAVPTGKTLGRDTIDAALQGNPSSHCRDFKTSALYAEISRFHNRVAYAAGGKEDRTYLIVPDVPPPEHALVTDAAELTTERVRSLSPFQPLLVSGALKGKIRDLPSAGLRIFTLNQNYPWTVSEGLARTAGADEQILVLRAE